MKTALRTLIENATVSIIETISKGVLIKNRFILTAGHCVNLDLDGYMDAASGEDYSVGINSYMGTFRATPIAIEPINDIAILGALDDQEFEEEVELFEDFCRRTKPIKVSNDIFEVGQRITVYIFTHESKWVSGYAYISSPNSNTLILEMEELIKKGTSGSGVYNENGEIVGIFKQASPDSNIGLASRPRLTLPVWVARQI